MLTHVKGTRAYRKAQKIGVEASKHPVTVCKTTIKARKEKLCRFLSWNKIIHGRRP